MAAVFSCMRPGRALAFTEEDRVFRVGPQHRSHGFGALPHQANRDYHVCHSVHYWDLRTLTLAKCVSYSSIQIIFQGWCL